MTTIGVVGAGTMGAGIAQIGVTSGFDVVLYDAAPEALERALERTRAGVTRGNEKGLWAADGKTVSHHLSLAAQIDALAGCDVVIEAAPERLELKRAIFAELASVCGPGTVLASNTSSIPLTQIAAGTPNPGQVIGMHFFNPVPLMGLVEVIPAVQSTEETVRRTTELGRALGKRVIMAPDGPGFLVNRCGRPFYGESLRVVTEQLASAAQIDRICRLGGGFRMGPFELMDLVGLDVNLEIAKSFTELSFGEPRWRPMIIQSRMVASGRLGRKTGRGWYEYTNGPHRPDDPPSPTAGSGEGEQVAVIGTSDLADHLRRLSSDAGFRVSATPTESATATVFADHDAGAEQITGAPSPIVSCASHSLAFRHLDGAVGFNLANRAASAPLVELTRGYSASDGSVHTAERLFARLGTHTEWVRDGPGLVLGRILVQIVNEAAFAYGEGLASAADIDTGAVLGLNYPRGPLMWGESIGWSSVLGALNGLWGERREERYRPAPALIAAAAGHPPPSTPAAAMR